MKLPLLQLWRGFSASYWFVPSLMVILAIVLGALMVWLDSGPAAGLLDALGWYQQSKPQGAREVLSAIAASMITVAGVVFSITIVAISFAANQYGPRILTNFMSDRGNQITLGTFIGTFVYSIVVLRTIYSGDSEFVPQLAVMVAMLLALCSIAVLIYFIHHVPESIHINTITAHVGRQLISSIDKQFPACFGDPPEHSAEQVEGFERAAEAAFGSGGNAKPVECRASGYLQAIDDGHLLSVARKHDLVISVQLAPGHFVYEGRTIALAAPSERLDEDAEQAMQASWAVGSSRTPDQDLLFLIDELVEIATRALSTGVNDPYTAMTCADWLTAAAVEFARRQPTSPYRLDEDGDLRVVAPTGTFGVHLERGFGHLRPYAAGDINAAVHLLSRIALIASEVGSDKHAETLSREAEALFALARRQHEGPSLERLEEEMAKTRAAILDARSRQGKSMKDAVDSEAAERARRQLRK
jgi:uncharacterized membrane protein